MPVLNVLAIVFADRMPNPATLKPTASYTVPRTVSVAGIQIGREAQGRTWYAATRRGVQPEQIRTFVDVLRAALARGDHMHPTVSAA